jgi:allantoate deiminase
MRRANEQVGAWMREAGMQVRTDAICNLIGRYEGTDAGAGTLLLGSHLDSVRDAGRYDGPLGVLVALACVERLHRARRRLPFAVEVIAFTDEEGLRYHTSFLGSSAVAGIFNRDWLQLQDADGITMEQTIRDAGGDPEAIESCRYDPKAVLGYCEVHIEQGPRLEDLDLPVGVVSGIASSNRATVVFRGVPGHAGTMPMRLRRDALCAAAEFVLEVERVGLAQEGLVATVGQIEAQPGASNVIPGQVTLSLDIRHEDGALRAQAYEALRAHAGAIAERREVLLEWTLVQEGPATPCTPALVERMADAVASLGYPVQRLASGAGHDCVALAQLTGVAMLFVRCKGGISHNPAESVKVEDIAVAIDVLSHVLDSLGAGR